MAQSAIRRSVIPPMAGERQVSAVKPHETISCSKINTDDFRHVYPILSEFD